MCGITGMYSLNGEPAAPVVLRRMADSLVHRGPDDEGTYIDGAFGLGHRRLSIIDLSRAGHQPMQTPDGRYVLSYNGEVYNFEELKLELEALGWKFRSRTDSEVVLYCLAQWGVEALQRLNGMFALALWDRDRRELLLARDRYGIKPLYYWKGGGWLLFGSEIKALLPHPAFHAEMDMEGLLEYFTFQNFFTDRTLFRGVSLLPAASWLRIRGDAKELELPVRYWDYSFQEPEQADGEGEYLEELDRLFHQAVNRQLVADVPVAAYLSGGMDSGSITAVAARQFPDMLTFTVGFDRTSASGIEISFDEREQAERMSYLFKTEHYEMVLKAGDMERAMKRLVWHMEEPRVGQCYPNFYAAQLAGKFSKVVLAGTGGDELFGGYPWRYYRAVNNVDFEAYIDKYYAYWQRLMPNRDLWSLFDPVRQQVEHVWTRDIFRDLFTTHAERLQRPEDYVNHSLYLEARTFLHGLLVVEDKLSMAHSLETRVPFLDNDLVDFAMQLPVRHKLGRLDEVLHINENDPGGKLAKYFEKTRDGKLLLRKMMAKYVPKDVHEGVKQGFSAPDASWFKGESIDFVRDLLLNPRARIYDYFDRKTAERLISDHLEGRQNRRLLIWSLLYLEQFCDTFLHSKATA